MQRLSILTVCIVILATSTHMVNAPTLLGTVPVVAAQSTLMPTPTVTPSPTATPRPRSPIMIRPGRNGYIIRSPLQPYDNYEECVAAFNLILPTFPPRCVGPDGKFYIAERPLPESVVDFETCARWSQLILPTYPARCVGPNGTLYIGGIDSAIEK